MDYQQCFSKNRKCGVERYLNLIFIGFKLLLNRIYQVYMALQSFTLTALTSYKMSCKNSILNTSQLFSGLCELLLLFLGIFRCTHAGTHAHAEQDMQEATRT